MNTINIGFVAHGPASANSLKPLIDILNLNLSNKVHLFAYHDYVAQLWNTDKFCCDTTYPEQLKKMDIIVYGTGSSNPIELGIAEFCLNNDIVSITILDLFWSDDEDLKQRFPVLPNHLLVPDQQTLINTSKVLGEGTNYQITGNPHFDRLQNQAYPRLLLPPFDVAFFSQCSDTSDYSVTNKDSLKALMELVNFRDKNSNYINEIFVSPHPREDIDFLKDLCLKYNLTFTDECSTQLMYRTDFTYGYKCTLQYEALLIGKPVSFYNQECLTTSINKHLEEYTKPQLHTVNATIKCLALISSVIDELVLQRTG